MKIVLVDNWTVVDAKGGTEKVLCNMANAMTERGHEVHILCYEDKVGMPFFKLDDKVKFKNMFKKMSIGLKIRNCFVNSKEKRRSNRLIFMGKRFVEEIKHIKPDVVVAFTRDVCYALAATLHKDIPVVFMYHFDADSILDDNFYHNAISNVDCIQVLMPSDIEKTKKYIIPQGEIIHIPNVVPQYENSADYSKKVIITVGRINKDQKQQHYLVEAFGKLNRKYPGWTVELWGEVVDVNYEKELQGIISRYKIENEVAFKGTTDDVPGKLAQASIFAFPSAFEGFPLALTEAMSMGLPAVAFKNCPAVNELIVDGSNGILVEQNLEAYTNGLETLMSSVDLRERLGKQAKKDMQLYEPKKIWDKWESLLLRLSEKQ